MFIECPYCAVRIDATVTATFEPPKEDFALDQDGGTSTDSADGAIDAADQNCLVPYRATLLYCEACHHLLLAYEEWDGLDETSFRDIWSTPKRVYPAEQVVALPAQIPQGIRDSLEEAGQCLRRELYRSTAVMCRRALEGVCRYYEARPSARPSLSTGLRDLRSHGVIDETLAQWAEALRLHGNTGAYPGSSQISKEDAQDLFDFAVAICQYVFVLSEKFRRFKERGGPGGQPAPILQ